MNYLIIDEGYRCCLYIKDFTNNTNIRYMVFKHIQ